MKPLITLGGDFKDSYTTVYIDSKYWVGDKVDMDAITDEGLDTLISCDSDWVNCNLRFGQSPNYENRSFVFVNIKDPSTKFNIKNIRSNVPVEVNYDFTFMGWVEYGLRTLISRLRL